jgi:hypothetical protein
MSTKTYYKMLTVALGIMMMAGLVLAAPPNTPMSEDLLGSRIYYRNRENEDNVSSIALLVECIYKVRH